MKKTNYYLFILVIIMFFRGELLSASELKGTEALSSLSGSEVEGQPLLNNIKNDTRQDDSLIHGSVGDSLFSYNSNQEQAFQNVARQAMPLTPEQIVRLKKMLDETKLAAAVNVPSTPEPKLTTKFVDLAPGTVPPVVRLQQGFITSISFLDSSGAVWPIELYNLGNPKEFNVKIPKGGNVVMIQALNKYGYGNLAIVLQDLDTPIVLTLVSGQKVVDFRLDLHIRKLGPNAIMSERPPKQADSILLSFLNEVMPRGAKSLKVVGDNSRAWSFQGKMYLRTETEMLSPSWLAKMTSADGTNMYEMEMVPVVLVSKNGEPIDLRIEGF